MLVSIERAAWGICSGQFDAGFGRAWEELAMICDSGSPRPRRTPTDRLRLSAP
jgi:hypothetical protein